MKPKDPSQTSDRIPRGALIVVAVGLIATLGVLALDWRGGGSSAELEWTTNEPVKVPAAAEVGPNGEFEMTRTQLSAIGQNGGGESVFRISGVLKVSTNGQKLPAEARCDIRVLDPDSSIARTPGRRAAWPRPTNDFDLKKQSVPEASVVKFNAVGNDVLGLPIRDTINRYSNTDSLVTADWAPYEEHEQTWIWKMPHGTGSGAVNLGYVVIFKTPVKPAAVLKCGATIDGKSVVQRVKAVQKEWPLPEPSVSSSTEDQADASNVE